MNVEFDYKDTLNEITGMISEMSALLGKSEKATLAEIGKVTVRAVKSILPRSDIERRVKTPKNYDKSTPYDHMIDDVSYSVRKSQTGDQYVSVKGGKNTGYKWHMLNDGWTDRGGVFHMGTKFMEKAVRQAEGAIDLEIDKLLKKVAG